MELRRHLALEEKPGRAVVHVAEAVVTEQPVSVRPHRSQEEKEFQPVGGLACAGFVQAAKVLGTYANRDPLVTLGCVLIVLLHKKSSSAPVQIKELMVCLRTHRLAFLLC